MRRSLLHFSKSARLSIAGYAGIFVFLFSVSTALSAQVDVTASGGTLMASYTTLKGAFDAINAGTHTGTIAISLTASTTETATAALNASGSGSASYTSVSIQPSVPVTVAGNIAGAIIKLNGADNVSIDGRIGGAGRNLTVQNTSTTASSAAIWLSSLGVGAGSANNIVRNCEIQCGITQNTSNSATYGIIMNGTNIITTSNGANNVPPQLKLQPSVKPFLFLKWNVDPILHPLKTLFTVLQVQNAKIIQKKDISPKQKFPKIHGTTILIIANLVPTTLPASTFGPIALMEKKARATTSQTRNRNPATRNSL